MTWKGKRSSLSLSPLIRAASLRVLEVVKVLLWMRRGGYELVLAGSCAGICLYRVFLKPHLRFVVGIESNLEIKWSCP